MPCKYLGLKCDSFVANVARRIGHTIVVQHEARYCDYLCFAKDSTVCSKYQEYENSMIDTRSKIVA